MKYTGKIVAFEEFSSAIKKQFDKMQKNGELYFVDIDKDSLWEMYLSSFPEGTNEVYNVRNEYDCSCCKSFIRQLGNVVAIINNKVVSIWDVLPGGYYNQVSTTMKNNIESLSIKSVYRISKKMVNKNNRFGIEHNSGLNLSGESRIFYHFYADIDSKFITDSVGESTGKANEFHDMLVTMTKKLNLSSIEIIRDLIEQNAIYRGAEHKNSVLNAELILKEFNSTDEKDLPLWYWVDNS